MLFKPFMREGFMPLPVAFFSSISKRKIWNIHRLTGDQDLAVGGEIVYTVCRISEQTCGEKY
jgi:hypothetical protein